MMKKYFRFEIISTTMERTTIKEQQNSYNNSQTNLQIEFC